MNDDHIYWKTAVRSRPFVLRACLVFTALVTLAFFSRSFFNYVQSVQGGVLNDPVLSFLPARNVSTPIFTLIYGGLLVSLIYMIQHPYLLLKAGTAYAILTVFRMCTLYFFPLEPPKDIVPLTDPLVDRFFYAGQVITKDLFFSGHTSVLFLCAFVVDKVYLKWIIGTAAVLVGFLLLIQHVHYTIDVVAAPVFSWVSLIATGYFLKIHFSRQL